MSFLTYPKYKDSGVEWLGEVPEHWHVRRMRFAVQVNPSKLEVVDLARETMVSFLPMEAVGDDGSLDLSRERPISEVESGYTYFRNGDVTIAKITPCFENGKGGLMHGLTNGIGFGTTELIVIRPTSTVLDRFLAHLVASRPFRDQGESYMYGAGGQKRVPDSFVRDFTTGFPPVAEQIEIADFLDRETTKIDALVAEQRRLIELLKEKRQAVISHAVTKGLNPHAPMKPSGIDWLGDVPAHWTITRLKHATTHIVDCPHETPTVTPDGEFLSIRTSDINDGRILPVRMQRVDEKEYRRRIRREPIMRDDIVYSREGGRWGHAALVPEDGLFCLGQRMMQFRASREFDPQYLMWHLGSINVYRQGDVDTVGAASPHVNVDTIRNYRIARPSRDEQEKIADFLSDSTHRYDTLTAETERTVELLHERRTALISAAVTGKIDVRSLAQSEADAA